MCPSLKRSPVTLYHLFWSGSWWERDGTLKVLIKETLTKGHKGMCLGLRELMKMMMMKYLGDEQCWDAVTAPSLKG